MCLTAKVAEVVYPANWRMNITVVGATPTCEAVGKQSLHNQTAPNGVPCDPTTQGTLKLTGQACLCTSELCNTGTAFVDTSSAGASPAATTTASWWPSAEVGSLFFFISMLNGLNFVAYH